MAEDILTTVELRNTFYKDSYRKVMMALVMSVVMNAILLVACVYLYNYTPPPTYFATSIDGRYTPIVALSEPNQSDSSVLQWANQAAIAAYTYNFVNYHDELRAASGFFTGEGWQQFITALEQSNNLDSVKAKKLVVSAVATGAPVILRKGILNGAYAWRVQMPILVTYQSASEFTQQNNVATLLITRVSTLNSPKGIGISQFVVAPAGGGVGG
jgi:intracellular multiplication protein IcmL